MWERARENRRERGRGSAGKSEGKSAREACVVEGQ